MDLKTFLKIIIFLVIFFVLFSLFISLLEETHQGKEEISSSRPLSGGFEGEENLSHPGTLSESAPAAGEARDSNEADLREVRGDSFASTDGGKEEATIRVGAFNVQVFGKTKASKPEVMDVLAKIIRTYDVVAIQEIRDSSQTALPILVETVNSEGASYSFVVSERLGRTSSKEQYAYVYNSTRLKLVGEPRTYSEPDGTDPFHREPYIASFETLDEEFSFALIVVHTDPDEASGEINSLSEVLEYAQKAYSEEDDFVVMGDLNADCSYFDEDKASSLSGEEYRWLIDNSMDTTTGDTDCTYDRIIITDDMQLHFTGDAGVFRYDLEYNLTPKETGAVSDHYPVYAEFSASSEEP